MNASFLLFVFFALTVLVFVFGFGIFRWEWKPVPITGVDIRPGWLWLAGGLALLYLFVLLPTVETIEAGHVGVVLRSGMVTGRVLKPGPNAKMPYFETVDEVRIQEHTLEVQVRHRTRDDQPVWGAASLVYQLDPDQLARVYAKVLPEEQWDASLEAVVKECFRATIVRYTAEETRTKREQWVEEFSREVKKRFLERGFVPSEPSLSG